MNFFGLISMGIKWQLLFHDWKEVDIRHESATYTDSMPLNGFLLYFGCVRLVQFSEELIQYHRETALERRDFCYVVVASTRRKTALERTPSTTSDVKSQIGQALSKATTQAQLDDGMYGERIFPYLFVCCHSKGSWETLNNKKWLDFRCVNALITCFDNWIPF